MRADYEAIAHAVLALAICGERDRAIAAAAQLTPAQRHTLSEDAQQIIGACRIADADERRRAAAHAAIPE